MPLFRNPTTVFGSDIGISGVFDGLLYNEFTSLWIDLAASMETEKSHQDCDSHREMCAQLSSAPERHANLFFPTFGSSEPQGDRQNSLHIMLLQFWKLLVFPWLVE